MRNYFSCSGSQITIMSESNEVREYIRTELIAAYSLGKNFADEGGVGVDPQFDEWASVDRILEKTYRGIEEWLRTHSNSKTLWDFRDRFLRDKK